MAAQRADTGTRPPAGRDGTHGARTPTHSWQSVRLSIHLSVKTQRSPGVGWLWAKAWPPRRRGGLATLQVSRGSLKGSRSGSARRGGPPSGGRPGAQAPLSVSEPQ